MNIPKPTINYIEELVGRYWEDYFSVTDSGLSKLFKLLPRNDDLSEVLIKVIVLNKLYNTNILNLNRVAEHIAALSIDKALSAGRIDVVQKIATVKFGRKKRHFYSFATKYCSWHFPEHFFIYDSFVDYVLWEYKNKFHFMDFFRYEMKEYESYHKTLTNLITFFGLEGISKKKLDEFLWLKGKRITKQL